MADRSELLIQAETLQNMLLARATGDPADDQEYRRLRMELLSERSLDDFVPRFVQTCQDLAQFWAFIKRKYAHYDERREFIWKEFDPLVRKLEGRAETPADGPVSDVLVRFDVETVHRVWERALVRREEDPEGAITAARTLLESVCKHILDDAQVVYPESADLPKLYRLTADELQLSPAQHSEQVFRQILGGCQAVVEGLGAVRNRLGDAHGKGKHPVKPSLRHAELAVNLSGAMSTFLVQTWEHRRDAP